MLLELARPVALLGCILSLLGVFHAAFLVPASDVEQRIASSFGPLLLAAGTALIGGLVFRGREFRGSGYADRRSSSAYAMSFLHTFPVQVFCWAAGGMVTLFVISWYLETHCIFYRDIHF
jgi:hypothetical protein